MADRSPATRAIVAAFNERGLAAALRALTEHGEAMEIRMAPGCFDFDEAVRCRDMEVIAAKLEGNTSTSSTH